MGYASNDYEKGRSGIGGGSGMDYLKSKMAARTPSTGGRMRCISRVFSGIAPLGLLLLPLAVQASAEPLMSCGYGPGPYDGNVRALIILCRTPALQELNQRAGDVWSIYLWKYSGPLDSPEFRKLTSGKTTELILVNREFHACQTAECVDAVLRGSIARWTAALPAHERQQFASSARSEDFGSPPTQPSLPLSGAAPQAGAASSEMAGLSPGRNGSTAMTPAPQFQPGFYYPVEANCVQATANGALRNTCSYSLVAYVSTSAGRSDVTFLGPYPSMSISYKSRDWEKMIFFACRDPLFPARYMEQGTRAVKDACRLETAQEQATPPEHINLLRTKRVTSVEGFTPRVYERPQPQRPSPYSNHQRQ